MGQEAHCSVCYGDRVSNGKAYLETEEVIFRGDFRLKIPFNEIRSAEARGGQLRLDFSQGVASFELGPKAATWAEKIRNPRTLLDKLGLKPESRVIVLGVQDEEFWRQLKARVTAPISSLDLNSIGSQSAIADSEPKADFIFLSADRPEALQLLRPLEEYLAPTGAIWVITPKGVPHITQNDVMAAGREAGLVDVKVASFSPSLSALKLVIPVARRPKT